MEVALFRRRQFAGHGSLQVLAPPHPGVQAIFVRRLLWRQVEYQGENRVVHDEEKSWRYFAISA